MAHGLARLSQRLRRKKAAPGEGEPASTQRQRQTTPPPQQQIQVQARPDKAGPATTTTTTTAAACTTTTGDDDEHDADFITSGPLQHPLDHPPLDASDADGHQSYPLASSLPADYSSLSEEVATRSGGAVRSISAALTPAQHSPREPDNSDEEGPHPGPRQSTPQNSLQSSLPLKESSARTINAFSFSSADAAQSVSTSTPSQRASTSGPPSRRVVPAAGVSVSATSLQTVDEGDGVSPTAVSQGPSLESEKSDADKAENRKEIPEGGAPAQSPGASRPTIAVRRQSLVPPSQQHLVNRVLGGGLFHRDSDPFVLPYSTPPADMVQRKIWVKRPDASATLVSMSEDSVVDELRDHVLRKYSNSLGKTFDPPDLMVRICHRSGSNRTPGPDRILSPEESLFALIDQYYPGGQTMEEALIIEAPPRRTPIKPSPRQSYYFHPEPGEHGEYFPLMPVPINVGTPPAHPASSNNSNVSAHQTSAMSVLTTGKVPPLPSPGSRPSRHGRRPPFVRHTTGSPTLIASAKDPSLGVNGQAGSSQPSLPTPPAPAAPPSESPTALVPTVRTASPRPSRKPKKATSPSGGAFGGLIEGTVPPINVLIVEDNIINQKLLEAFMKRLSVRWQCAPNGEVAVKKWRQGGFHLVLMDIQLPVMNGLDATKEIRRLERLNGIGVFSKTASGRSSAASTTALTTGPPAESSLKEEDILQDLSLFKSPVIIVALTASSLQSDRHEALAAGCNDFLTKPIGFPWLEQKVTEWGCMQALIDFEGWRKWRGYEDSPRNFAAMKIANNPMSPTRNDNMQTIKVFNSKEGSQVSVTEPDSSGSTSSKEDESPEPAESKILGDTV